ncbi:unnamed protein product [Mytilus coruscus]|uniref:Endonuclease/exonuclease/phosphatase domain-containing protein n=1 Tax=Mytilus coruscus TaxID=42192 RepID=A0A6J8DY62_MYTCO|nr:unnamed protein product [Mytilus coruscus]
MKMDSVVEFLRAHRFGKESFVKDSQNRNVYTTRPIVCRFKSFKDRELVRYAASALKGTRFGVNEQYPKEINDRRKLLWSYFKEAKSQKQKVHLKKDRLFIDGAEFIPPDRNDEARMETNERQLYIGRGARPKTTTYGPNNQTRNTGQDPHDLGIPRKRNSQDQTVNTYGRKLISFCNNNNIVILNGRFLSDKVGKPTSRNSSVVDYVLGSANMFHKIVDFEIMQFSNLYSDIHTPIFLQLDCNVKSDMLKVNTCIRNNDKYIGKWKHEKSTNFTRNTNRDEVNELLSHILEIHDDISKVDQSNVNEIVTNVTKILLDSAEKTFGVFTKDCSNSKEDYNNKEWFNHDCVNSRKN